MKRLLALLVALFVIPVGVMAAETQQIMLDYDDMAVLNLSGSVVDYDAYNTEGHVIGLIEIYAPAGSEVSVSLYDTGQVITANASIADDLETSAVIDNLTLDSGGAINTWAYPLGQDFSGFHRILHFDYMTASIYSEDSSSKTVFLRYQTWSSSSGTVIGSVSVPLNNIIYRVVVTSNSVVDVRIWHDSTDSIYGQISKQQEATGSFVDMLLGVISNIYWITYIGCKVFSKLFIENFTVLFTLYEVLVAAIAYGRSRDIWTAHRKFIRYNVALFEFIYRAIVGFLNIINGILLRL